MPQWILNLRSRLTGVQRIEVVRASSEWAARQKITNPLYEIVDIRRVK